MRTIKEKTLFIIILFISFTSCMQNHKVAEEKGCKASEAKEGTVQTTHPHRFGGWYCPDNLRGFPAVDIAHWKEVPVINGRMATKEETQTSASLIFVDPKKYPEAKVLAMTMPRLARVYNEYSRRLDLIIAIQAFTIDRDTIIGFRYLNGGNGSARIHKVQFLNQGEINLIPPSRFISYSIEINAPQDTIWKILTEPKYSTDLQSTFDPEGKLSTNWRKTTNVNFHYSETLPVGAASARKLFGNFYIQNDYRYGGYSNKLLLLENPQTKKTKLQIVFGPYRDDFTIQKARLKTWAKKVKDLSEGC